MIMKEETWHAAYMKQVYVYHKAFPMPALSFNFNSADTFSGHHDMDDAAQFISSVCWRGQSSTLVAANSSGNIKILEMVWFSLYYPKLFLVF